MWRLESEKEDEEGSTVYYLLADKEFVVGRKSCDILIVKDASVSRKHATLRTSHPMCNVGNLKLKSVCTVKDCGSKYGTFVNGKQVEPEEGAILKHKDLITFGQCGGNFRVYYDPVIVTTSCMDPTEKTSLRETVRLLGAHLVEEWNTECTHLGMTKVKVTVKTLCALVSNKPIVRWEYFKMLLDSYNAKEAPDKPCTFLPPVEEVLLNHKSVRFTENPERSNLFEGKTFIFLTAPQYLKLRLPITLGGGRTVLINRSRCDVTNELLLASVVIDHSTQSGKSQASQVCSSKEIQDIERLLQQHDKRLISELEVGMAVVHCSTEQYCNPDCKIDLSQISTPNASLKLQSQTLSQSFVLVPETMENTQEFPTGKLTNARSLLDKEIPPTFRTSTEPSVSIDKGNCELSSTINKKRGSSDETLETPLSKVPKTEVLFEENDCQEQVPKNLGSFTLEDETETTPVCNTRNAKNTFNKVGAAVLKERPLVNNKDPNLPFEKNTLVEDPDTPNKKSLLGGVKEEPASPPQTEELIHDEEQSQERSMNNIVHATSRIHSNDENEVLPAKRKRIDSDEKPELQSNGVSSRTIPIKVSATVSSGFVSGFTHSRKSEKAQKDVNETTAVEEDLPSNLLVVKLADLVLQHRKLVDRRQKHPSNSKNYKKFRKTLHCGAAHLPRIIGGHDLVVHTSKENLEDLSNFLHQQETESSQPSEDNCNTSFKARFSKLKS